MAAVVKITDGQLEYAPDDHGPALRSRLDNLTVWQSIKHYKLVTALALAAAFSASLDGYQISLNAGIVANKGFISRLFGPEVTVIEGQYVSAWGGIQSAGQTLAQIFLPFLTDAVGRKPALMVIWICLVASIFIETFTTTWQHWLIAKLFAGMGVGMLQATLPVYLSEIAPTQLKGFIINAYTFWFVIGQLCGSVALNELHNLQPLNFRLAILTQWAMVGAMGLIFVLVLPETPWWLVGKGKTEKAAKVLSRFNGHVAGYNVHEHIGIISATLEEESSHARASSEEGLWAVFKGRNALRFLIASWPKILQQLVGLTVFNTYSTYFFQYAGNKDPFQVTVILTCVQIISMIVTCSLSDSVGRRPLTVYPYGVTAAALLSLGIIGCFNYSTKAIGSLLVFFACLATFSTTGASAIGYAYAAEIPEQRLRARTAGWALAFSNLVAIMFNFTTPLMINGQNTHWGPRTGFFFAGTGAVGTVIAWFILPEVARRTPAEIDELFQRKVNLRKFDKYVTEVQVHAQEVHVKEGKKI